jgi:hypothetical protein
LAQEWYLMSNNKFLGGLENEEISNYYSVFDEILAESPEAYDVLINGNSKRVIIQSSNQDNKRVILSNIDDIKIGDIVEHKGLKWLVTTFTDDNNIYERGEMMLCNTQITLQIAGTKTQVGTTPYGEPIYEESPPTILTFDCVIRSVREIYTDLNDQINLPEGRMVLMIQNTDQITEGTEIQIYENKYKVFGVDKSKTLGNEGVLILTVDRV